MLDEPTNHLDLVGIRWKSLVSKSAGDASAVQPSLSRTIVPFSRVSPRIVEISPAYGTHVLRERQLHRVSAPKAGAPRFAGKIAGHSRSGAGSRLALARAAGPTDQAKGVSTPAMTAWLEQIRQRNQAAGRRANLDFNASGRRTRKLLDGRAGQVARREEAFADLDVLSRRENASGCSGPTAAARQP